MSQTVQKERAFAKRALEIEKLRKDYESSPKDYDLFARDEAFRGKHLVNYREYLQSPLWQRKRLLALKRANFRCQSCNREGRLEVHHTTYAQLGREQMHHLLVLCRQCHQNEHDTIDRLPRRPAGFSLAPPKTVKSTQGFTGHERISTPHDESVPSSPGNRYSKGPVGIQGKRPFAENAVSVTDPRRGMT